MKISIFSQFAAFALLAITGCEKNGIVQTVDWYKANKPERLAMLEKCKANPGELMATPNCINANRAVSELTWGAKKGIEVKPLSAKDMGLK